MNIVRLITGQLGLKQCTPPFFFNVFVSLLYLVPKEAKKGH